MLLRVAEAEGDGMNDNPFRPKSPAPKLKPNDEIVDTQIETSDCPYCEAEKSAEELAHYQGFCGDCYGKFYGTKGPPKLDPPTTPEDVGRCVRCREMKPVSQLLKNGWFCEECLEPDEDEETEETVEPEPDLRPKYLMVPAGAPDHLEKEVNRRIADGYRPIGGVSVVPVKGNYCDSYEFFQAMVLDG